MLSRTGEGKERKVKATMTAVRIGYLLDSTRYFLMGFGGIRQGSFPYGIKGGLRLRLDGGDTDACGSELGVLGTFLLQLGARVYPVGRI